MYNSIENHSFSNLSATPAVFTLRGGNYSLTLHANFSGGGTVDLQRLAPDGATFVSVLQGGTAFSADGSQNVNLPSGTYKLVIATATAVYADIVAVVTSQ